MRRFRHIQVVEVWATGGLSHDGGTSWVSFWAHVGFILCRFFVVYRIALPSSGMGDHSGNGCFLTCTQVRECAGASIEVTLHEQRMCWSRLYDPYVNRRGRLTMYIAQSHGCWGSRPAIPVHWLSWFSNGSLPLSATVPSHSGSSGVGDRDLARSGKSTCGIFLF